MSKKTDQLSSLLADYPELGAGLSQLMEEEGSEVTGMVGIYTLLKLRLRAVVSLLPRADSDVEDRPQEGGGASA